MGVNSCPGISGEFVTDTAALALAFFEDLTLPCRVSGVLLVDCMEALLAKYDRSFCNRY